MFNYFQNGVGGVWEGEVIRAGTGERGKTKIKKDTLLFFVFSCYFFPMLEALWIDNELLFWLKNRIIQVIKTDDSKKVKRKKINLKYINDQNQVKS